MNPWHPSALVCRLANHANTLSLQHSQLFFSQTQKSPVFEGAQRGLTSHFTRAGGHIRRRFQTVSQWADNSYIWSKWRGCVTLQFKFTVYNIVYITKQWGGVELQWKMTRKRRGGVNSKTKKQQFMYVRQVSICSLDSIHSLIHLLKGKHCIVKKDKTYILT